MAYVHLCASDNPNQSIVVFSESENAQKLYWLDGLQAEPRQSLVIHHLALCEEVCRITFHHLIRAASPGMLIIKTSVNELVKVFTEFNANPLTWVNAELAARQFQEEARYLVEQGTIEGYRRAITLYEYLIQFEVQGAHSMCAYTAHLALQTYSEAPDIVEWEELATLHYQAALVEDMPQASWLYLYMFAYEYDQHQMVRNMLTRIEFTGSYDVLHLIIHDVHFVNNEPLHPYIRSKLMEVDIPFAYDLDDKEQYATWLSLQLDDSDLKVKAWLFKYRYWLMLAVLYIVLFFIYGTFMIFLTFVLGGLAGLVMRMAKGKKQGSPPKK